MLDLLADIPGLLETSPGFLLSHSQSGKKKLQCTTLCTVQCNATDRSTEQLRTVQCMAVKYSSVYCVVHPSA